MADTPVRSDGYSYYVYLPSWVIYQDGSLETLSNPCCGGVFPAWSGITRWPGTNRWVNPHPMGVALLALPFYFAGHFLAVSGIPTNDALAAGLAGVFYLVAGLYALKRLLARHFRDSVVIATLVCITFGTNLFHYATFDNLWSPSARSSCSPASSQSPTAGVRSRRAAERRDFLAPALWFLSLNLCLVASWWDWQLGASYGHRGFTESLAILAIPMAALYERASYGFCRDARVSVILECCGVAYLSVRKWRNWQTR